MHLEPFQQRYRDIFMLIFYLCGINMIDLAELKEIKNGYICYRRSKTNKLYTIKVEPEAAEIINKYKGKNYLINIKDNYKNYYDFTRRMNKALQRFGECSKVGRGGRKVIDSCFPHLTSYWARRTWATIAAELDIPKETIAAALGHGAKNVTDIYINFDTKKIEAANRIIIDKIEESF